jgi:hypothetical protein
MYRAFSERSDANPDALADWVLRHKGEPNLPFGSMTLARTLEGWRAGQRFRTSSAPCDGRRTESALKSGLCGAPGEGNRAKCEGFGIAYRSTARGRLFNPLAIVSDNSLPLDPSTLIIECISEARNLDNDSKQNLLTRIDRCQGRPWKNLRAYWFDHENA